MRDTGRITNRMDRELSSGLMAVSTRDNLKMVKSMGKALIYGQTGVITQVHGSKTSYLGMENISGCRGGLTRDNG